MRARIEPSSCSGRRPVAVLSATVAILALGACDSLTTIDRHTNDALTRSADHVGELASRPQYDPSKYQEGNAFPPAREQSPPSRNPPVDALNVEQRDTSHDTTQDVIDRFTKMVATPADARVLSFAEALLYATEHATEYLTAEESYIITALRLLIEEHRWGPRFFNETSATFAANANSSGRYATTVNLLNNFGVTQKLPYGGEVSARFLVAATEELDNAVGSSGGSADVLLGANIPLLRGAGTLAQESLVQARRDLIYAARDFQNFRRTFYLELAADYLQLIFQKQQIVNSEGQVRRSREVEARTVALVDSGRTEPFQADLAKQNTLFAIDRLAQLNENFRFFIDRFKLRLGMDTSAVIDVAEEALRLPPLTVSLEEAVRLALEYRLDLQTEADRVDDARRTVDLAKNDLQGDLNVVLAADIPTEGTRVRPALQFRPGQTDFTAGITYSLPLDRAIEQARYREAQIRLEQQRRAYRQLEDQVALQARQAVRAIEKAQFTILISQKNVDVSDNRLAAIDAAPDRANARDRTEAVNNLQRAQDTLQQAQRDLQLAIVGYLGTTGQLRVAPDGQLEVPPGISAGNVP